MVNFSNIRKFLAHPDNAPLVYLYEESASELEAKLIAWVEDGKPYEKLLENTLARIVSSDSDLKRNKSLCRTLVYYMYCRCDIAKIYES